MTTETLHPQELTLRLGDGKDYVFSPLTYKDWEDLATAWQFSGYNKIKDQPWATPQELKAALAIAMTLKPTQEQLEEFIMSSSGMAEILYLSLRKKQPRIKRGDVAGLFTMKEQELVQTIAEFIQKTSLPDVEEEEPGNAPGVEG